MSIEEQLAVLEATVRKIAQAVVLLADVHGDLDVIDSVEAALEALGQ